MPHPTTRRVGVPAAALAVLVLVGTVCSSVPAAATPVAAGQSRAAAAGPRLVRDGAGRVRLLAADGARVPGLAAGVSAVTAARAQLARVGHVFGVATADLRTAAITQVSGRNVVRFQQTRDGLPVYAGQLVTVLDGHGGLLSVSGETAGPAGGDLSTAYVVAASTAARTARRAVASSHGVTALSLDAIRPTRWLFDRSLVDPRAAPVLRPVWRVAVRSASRPDLSETVLVDARTGRVALQVSEVAGLDRVVCDDIRTRSYRCRSGLYDRVEGGPPTGLTDADQAYDLTGTTAAWYAGTLGVDLTALIGTDFGDGRKLRSTTNFCPPGACPLDNAFWSGDQMVYGAGYTSADDVVAHELTHGVTQNTAGLIYWYQSGAINESMSDVFGELVDQADGVGNDSAAVRWELGEDLPGGTSSVARDMADPPRFSQPDTTSSTLYDVALDYDDNGAVHTNSGVPNKTAYLIADGTVAEPGGAFHGPPFAGIGTARTASLYWAVLQMLTPGSDFVDLAAALRQACANLGFTAAECATVSAAVDATGLNRWTGPSAPRRVTMTPGPGLVHLTWESPVSPGSMPVSSYVVSVSPAVRGNDVVTLEPTTREWVLDGLLPGVDYVVRLIAVSSDGTSPPVTRTLSGTTLAVSARPQATWGGRVIAQGSLRNTPGAGLPGRRVTLVRREAGSTSSVPTLSTTTGADGTYRFAWVARRNVSWYVQYSGAGTEIGVRSVRRATLVHQLVRLTASDLSVPAGQPVTLTGTVRPTRATSGRVLLQRRRADGAWVAAGRARLEDGSWSLTWRVPTGRPTALRVRVAARPAAGLAAGVSRVVTLNPR